ncbi:hypothetical protein ACFL26_00945 [Patescibacteria group bacterium]
MASTEPSFGIGQLKVRRISRLIHFNHLSLTVENRRTILTDAGRHGTLPRCQFIIAGGKQRMRLLETLHILPGALACLMVIMEKQLPNRLTRNLATFDGVKCAFAAVSLACLMLLALLFDSALDSWVGAVMSGGALLHGLSRQWCVEIPTGKIGWLARPVGYMRSVGSGTHWKWPFLERLRCTVPSRVTMRLDITENTADGDPVHWESEMTCVPVKSCHSKCAVDAEGLLQEQVAATVRHAISSSESLQLQKHGRFTVMVGIGLALGERGYRPLPKDGKESGELRFLGYRG